MSRGWTSDHGAFRGEIKIRREWKGNEQEARAAGEVWRDKQEVQAGDSGVEVMCEDGWKGRFCRISFRKPG